jgi:hypothetical protein
MPTFLILKGTHVKETIRGANPTALRTAVLAAAADAAKGPAAKILGPEHWSGCEQSGGFWTGQWAAADGGEVFGPVLYNAV